MVAGKLLNNLHIAQRRCDFPVCCISSLLHSACSTSYPCASSPQISSSLSHSTVKANNSLSSADLQKTTNVDVYLSPENTALVCVCVDVLPFLPLPL